MTAIWDRTARLYAAILERFGDLPEPPSRLAPPAVVGADEPDDFWQAICLHPTEALEERRRTFVDLVPMYSEGKLVGYAGKCSKCGRIWCIHAIDQLMHLRQE